MAKRTKNAVITGAASGLGRDIAIELGRRGFHIMISDINPTESNITLTMVEQAGGSGETYLCDVTKASEVMAMAEYAYKNHDHIDLLVNNAGVAAGGLVGDMPIEDWHWLVSINFWGMVYGCHAFIPKMRRDSGGHIINIASAAGIVCLPEMACYNASKAAIISLSETLRAEVAPYNIGVTVICPSFFNTDLMREMRYCDDFQCDFAQAAFQNARITSEDIAKMLVKAYERNKLYVLPQTSAKLQWFFKRLSPARYYDNFAALNKSALFRRLAIFLAKCGMT